MPKSLFRGAPQLSRIVKEIPLELIVGFLRSKVVSDLVVFSDDVDLCDVDAAQGQTRSAIAELPEDDLSLIEAEAARVAALSTPRADGLHLRMAEGAPFELGDQLSDCPGALARAVWSYSFEPNLFVATERAMQVRSFRENNRVFQSYEIKSARPLDLDEIDESALISEIDARLQLRDGCSIEAVELPHWEASPREIMIAVTTGGARASHKTFEPDRSTGVTQFRPASELILVYQPKFGRIEVCGRQWKDRKLVASIFAGHILNEEISARLLTQRSYDLSMFRRSLCLKVPKALRDRILDVQVIELRVALGDYNQKITLTVTPGESIEALRQEVFGKRRAALGRGFVCDVELFLKVVGGRRGHRLLRIRINNHNSCDLQSQTDVELRDIGFALLAEWGVAKSSREASRDEKTALLPMLLRLLDHPTDDIAEPELRQMGADVDRLDETSFLRKRQIVETLVIDGEDVGPVVADVVADHERGTATASLTDGEPDGEFPISEVSRWTIHREYILETFREALDSLEPSGPVRDVSETLYSLGSIRPGERQLTLFVGHRLHEAAIFDQADRLMRTEMERAGGVVLTPTDPPFQFMGSCVMLSLVPLLHDTTGLIDPIKLEAAWRAGKAGAEAGNDVSFQKTGNGLAQLVIPGKPAWTVSGAKRVKLVERLFTAYCNGEIGVELTELLDYAGVKQLGPSFGSEWKTAVKGTYIINPRRRYWAIAG